MKLRNPRTRPEWLEAVNVARFYLLVDSAEQYGLITAPKMNAARCEFILAEGKRHGFNPPPDDVLMAMFLQGARHEACQLTPATPAVDSHMAAQARPAVTDGGKEVPGKREGGRDSARGRISARRSNSPGAGRRST